jgi:peptidoglycan-N-acetylglucosamine deacetylase
VLVSNGSGAVVTGLVLGVLMALVVGEIEGSTADLDSTATATDAPTGVDAGTDPAANSADNTELGLFVPGVIRTTGRSGQTVALTFSAGPDPRYTPEILAILAAEDIKATFCVVGSAAEEQPDVIRQIADGGHVLCNQTANDDFDLASRDEETQRAEIGGAQAVIRAAEPNAAVPFFRAPGGSFSPELVDIAATYDMASLGWSVDPQDWTMPGAAAIQSRVVDAVEPGSIVVLHDGGGDRTETVDALAGIIDELMAEGYQFVTPAP